MNLQERKYVGTNIYLRKHEHFFCTAKLYEKENKCKYVSGDTSLCSHLCLEPSNIILTTRARENLPSKEHFEFCLHK